MSDVIEIKGYGSLGVVVVGEASYRKTFEWIFGKRCADGYEAKCHANLLREPNNKYDKNAVQVRLLNAVLNCLLVTIVLATPLSSQVAGQDEKHVQIIAESMRGELRANIAGAAEAIPYLEEALTASKKAKIDKTLEKNDFRIVDVPNSARPNFFNYLIASPNKQQKEAFIADLDSKLVNAVKTLKFRAEPKLNVYSLDYPVTAGTAGSLYDPYLKVLKVISKTEFLGAYQSSRYRDEYLFSGWDTSKLSDGATTSFEYENAVCPGNQQLPLTNGGTVTVLHLVRVDEKTFEAAINSLPVDDYQIAKPRSWELKDGTIACVGVVVDLDRESIQVKTSEGQVHRLALQELANEDSSFIRDQFKRPKASTKSKR